MTSKSLGVSVLIRTRNMEKHFRRLLEELSYQILKPSEIIVVDNFSSQEELKNVRDALSDAKEKYFDNRIPVMLIPISDSEFSHPYSTNIGVSVAKNELICITNGHCLPISNSWLESGMQHFRNPSVAGICGCFISHVDGGVWEKFIYGFVWPRVNWARDACNRNDYFSTVNCIIRKSLWKEYPFDESLQVALPEAKAYGGEDYDWAREMVARGYKVIVEPRFNVYHSHSISLPKMIAMNWKWYRIRREIDSFVRPRKSSTRVNV